MQRCSCTEPSERQRQRDSKSAKNSSKGKSVYGQAVSSSKRLKPNPTSRLQAIENLTRSTANLAKQTARTVAVLFSFAVITVLCPRLAALTNAAAVVVQDPTNPMEVQFQRWGCLVSGLAEDPKTVSPHLEVLKAHAEAVADVAQIKGKLLYCRVKQTYRNSEIFLIQFKVADELLPAAQAVVETLVKAGGVVSYSPDSRSPGERQVQDDMDKLDQSGFSF